MLTELCQELKNWFDRDQPKWIGEITLDASGQIKSGDEVITLQEGQYFRIVQSTFNDGVHQYPVDSFKSETFNGAIWAMAIPPQVLQLAEDIKAWHDKYGNIDSAAMSPFNSESFAGYSYTKSGGGSAAGLASGGAGTWQGVFASRMKLWRKI
jgi:hypothetical protein